MREKFKGKNKVVSKTLDSGVGTYKQVNPVGAEISYVNYVKQCH